MSTGKHVVFGMETSQPFNIVISSEVSIANVIEKSQPLLLLCRIHVVWSGAEWRNPDRLKCHVDRSGDISTL